MTPPIVSVLHPAPGRSYVLARPEHVRDVVHIGDVYVVPLFDGRIGDVAGPLRDGSSARIARQSIKLGATTVGSERARAFRAAQPGDATVIVDLIAAAYHERCLSCRAVHYFVTIER